ncbi:MAG TPA: hypothetical protein VEB22_04875 [Phycisphaerales bacterium]|nr:hypothetical protein [Phycisphaerales bacterium]
MVLTLMTVAAALANPVTGARAEPAPVVVLDAALRPTIGDLVSLKGDVATLRVAGKDVAVERPVAVVSTTSWGPDRDWPGIPKDAPLEGPGMAVELTDGTRLRGDLLPGKGDGLVLVHRQLGKVEFPLDSLVALGVHGQWSDGQRRRGDQVQLANGDRLDGFIESIAAKQGTGLAVTIERSGDKSKTTVPLERVSSLALGGGAATKPGTLVWLAGGERATAVEYSIDKREARLVRAKGALAARLDAARVEATLLAPASVTPLASCALKSGAVDPGPEQPLGTRDLTIPEPGEARWVLPAGAARISGWAVLPEECRRWGDCTVIITVVAGPQVAPRQLASFTLSGGHAVVAIDADLPASKEPATLLVTVAEGRNGPVQDRVVLRRMLVGFENAGERAPPAGAPAPPATAP